MLEYTAKAKISRSCVNDDATIVLHIELRACKHFSAVHVYSLNDKNKGKV